MMRGFARLSGIGLLVILLVGPSPAAGQGGSAGAVMNLLKSGKVPPERLGPVLEIVCVRGNPAELAYVLDRVLEPDAFPPAVRSDVLHKLADAAVTRKVIPEGDLSGVAELLASDDPQLREAAIELAGLWKVEAALASLAELAGNEQATLATRSAPLGVGCRI